jgi:hypothetical protein
LKTLEIEKPKVPPARNCESSGAFYTQASPRLNICKEAILDLLEQAVR